MKALTLAVAFLLQLWTIEAAETAVVPQDLERVHPRDVLTKRAGRDCGTWVFYCGGVPEAGKKGERGVSAEGACNNACYYINFLTKNGDYTATYDPDLSQTKNREHSGCRPKAGNNAASICNVMPFSQRYDLNLSFQAVQGFLCADRKRRRGRLNQPQP